MQSSVAERKTVDEQNQIILLATPVMTQGRFVQLPGPAEGGTRMRELKRHQIRISTSVKLRVTLLALSERGSMKGEPSRYALLGDLQRHQVR